MVNRDSSFSETHWETKRKPKTDGRTAIQTEEWETRREEWMMRGGRADVWGPPCLPTMSSSPLFPHLSVSFPPALLLFLLFSLMFFSIFFCCYFSPLPLFLSVCFFLSLSFSLTLFFASLFLQLSLFLSIASALPFLSLILSVFALVLSVHSFHVCLSPPSWSWSFNSVHVTGLQQLESQLSTCSHRLKFMMFFYCHQIP